MRPLREAGVGLATKPEKGITMADKPTCASCGHRLWTKTESIRLMDKDYHRVCLEREFAKVNIHIELQKMGLDQPPLPAA